MRMFIVVRAILGLGLLVPLVLAQNTSNGTSNAAAPVAIPLPPPSGTPTNGAGNASNATNSANLTVNGTANGTLNSTRNATNSTTPLPTVYTSNRSYYDAIGSSGYISDWTPGYASVPLAASLGGFKSDAQSSDTNAAAPATGPSLAIGQILGIVVGGLAAVCLIALVIAFSLRRRRPRRYPPQPPAAREDFPVTGGTVMASGLETGARAGYGNGANVLVSPRTLEKMTAAPSAQRGMPAHRSQMTEGAAGLVSATAATAAMAAAPATRSVAQSGDVRLVSLEDPVPMMLTDEGVVELHAASPPSDPPPAYPRNNGMVIGGDSLSFGNQAAPGSARIPSPPHGTSPSNDRAHALASASSSTSSLSLSGENYRKSIVEYLQRSFD